MTILTAELTLYAYTEMHVYVYLNIQVHAAHTKINI